MARTTHGLSGHPLYSTWKMMIDRCDNPDGIGYPRYGGKGIQVCERWHDLTRFIMDIESEIGPRPEDATPAGHPLYSLDRIRGNGNYEPGNVRWATWKQQAANRKRPDHWIPRA